MGISISIPFGSRGRSPRVTIYHRSGSGGCCSGIFGLVFIIAATVFCVKSCDSNTSTTPQKQSTPTIDAEKSTPTNEPARPAAQTTEDKFRLRAIIAALSYAQPKLKDPESYTFKSCERFKHADMEFYLVRFAGDGRNLRVGVKVADDGTTSIIDKSKMPEIMKSSTPANSPNQ